jgi:hypothetical protein
MPIIESPFPLPLLATVLRELDKFAFILACSLLFGGSIDLLDLRWPHSSAVGKRFVCQRENGMDEMAGLLIQLLLPNRSTSFISRTADV